MYFGSVKFFKHLIIGTVTAMIIIPTALSIHYSTAYHRMLAQTDTPRASAIDSQSGPSPVNGGSAVASIAKGAFNLIYASDSGTSLVLDGSLLPYQSKYPNLYVENNFEFNALKDKLVYLTFDDGPSSLTPDVLDILKAYNIKATFFIVYKDSAEAKALYRRMVDEGHTIGVHSTTHVYKAIYKSVDSYLTDFAQTAQMLESATGTKIELFRFPGGSVNAYNRSVYMPLIAEMTRRGYTYYDWNVGSGDTIPQITSQTIYENVVNGVAAHQESIVLMHDLASHDNTLAALPRIIQNLRDSGYSFAALDKTVKPVAFGYPD